MHMADALLSPTVGVALWGVSAAALGLCARQLGRADAADAAQRVPLMGVLGAFVFAAQMINFAIPATGSSGHMGGGLLLALLLGPHAALVVMASVLTVQALFFADGGLLALGANLFNLGVAPCCVGYVLVVRPLLGGNPLRHSRRRVYAATLLGAVAGAQLGALGVVLQTCLSGISNLPVGGFLLLMQPIHLAIGAVEGLATAVLLLFIGRARPELFAAAQAVGLPRRSARPLLLGLGVSAALVAGVLSWFASTQPDGLEWSLARASAGGPPGVAPSPLHTALARLQRQTAWVAGDPPDLGPGAAARPPEAAALAMKTAPPAAVAEEVGAGGSLAGLVGAAATLALVTAAAWLARRRRPAP